MQAPTSSGLFVGDPIETQPPELAAQLADLVSSGPLTGPALREMFAEHDPSALVIPAAATFEAGAQAVLADLVAQSMTLAAFSLRGVTGGDSFDVAGFVTGCLVENLSVQHVDLANCGLSATAAKQIADLVLPWNRTAIVLNFDGNAEFGDSGVCSIVSSMEQHASSVQRLSLCGCGATVEGVAKALKAVDGLPCLVQLGLSGNAGFCHANKAGIRAADEALSRNAGLMFPGEEMVTRPLWDPAMDDLAPAAGSVSGAENSGRGLARGGSLRKQRPGLSSMASSGRLPIRREGHGSGARLSGSRLEGSSRNLRRGGSGSFTAAATGRVKAASIGSADATSHRAGGTPAATASQPAHRQLSIISAESVEEPSATASRHVSAAPSSLHTPRDQHRPAQDLADGDADAVAPAAEPAPRASGGSAAERRERPSTETSAGPPPGKPVATTARAAPRGGAVSAVNSSVVRGVARGVQPVAAGGAAHVSLRRATPTRDSRGGTPTRRASTPSARPPWGSGCGGSPALHRESGSPQRKAALPPEALGGRARAGSAAPASRGSSVPRSSRRGSLPPHSLTPGGASPSRRPRAASISQARVDDGADEWRGVCHEANHHIRLGPAKTTEEDRHAAAARLARSQPKFCLGKRFEKTECSALMRSSPRAVPLATPAEAARLAPWARNAAPGKFDASRSSASPSMSMSQSPRRGGAGAAGGAAGSTVGQVHYMEVVDRRGGHKVVRVIDGGVTTYLESDPRDIGFQASRIASGMTPADGKLFASNTQRDLRFGVTCKERSYVRRQAQAPGPGAYSVPDYWETRAQRLRERARNMSASAQPLFGASAAPRSVWSTEKDLTTPGPGEYEIP